MYRKEEARKKIISHLQALVAQLPFSPTKHKCRSLPFFPSPTFLEKIKIFSPHFNLKYEMWMSSVFNIKHKA